MISLFLHGSGMLKNVPIKKNQMFWNREQASISLLELGTGNYEFPKMEQEDFLVVDMAYTVASRVVINNNSVYTVNAKNKQSGLIQDTDLRTNIMQVGLNGVKEYFDNYIAWLKEHVKKEHVILVKMECPKYCINGGFVAKHTDATREQFNKVIKEFEDYFIQQINPIVVEISKHYFYDFSNSKYGRYVAYESGFIDNMREILREIVIEKSKCICFQIPSYRILAERYCRYYQIAYERNEQYILMDKSTPVSQIIRAMNRSMINEYKDDLDAMARLTPESFDNIIANYDFAKKADLKEFIEAVQTVAEGRIPENSSVLEKVWGTKSGIELDLLLQVRKYYADNRYFLANSICLDHLREWYMAMLYAKKEEYLEAISYINQLLQKYVPKAKVYKTKEDSENSLREAIAHFGMVYQPIPVDVWGNFATNKILYPKNGKYQVQAFVNSLCCIHEEEVNQAKTKLMSSNGEWLLFDIFNILAKVKPEEEAEREAEIKERLDRFMCVLSELYDNRLILHKWKLQTEYRISKDKTEVYEQAESLAAKSGILEKYQDYIQKKYNCYTIDIAKQYSLSQGSVITIAGINYEWSYFKNAYKNFDAIVSEKNKKKKGFVCENYVSAYLNANLGDDIFLDMLLERYPQQNFYAFAKNRELAGKYDSYENLNVDCSYKSVDVKRCKNHILIGGSMFIEGAAWKVKYSDLKQLFKKARKNYVLGVNFGPWENENYLEDYKGLFQSCKDICFREKYSYELFDENKNARLAPDMLFAYKAKKIYEEENKVVISVISLAGRKQLSEYQEVYYSKMAEVCEEFIQNGVSVCMMSFCNYEGDTGAIEDILGRMSQQMKEQVLVHSYTGDNLEETIAQIASAKYVIGTRFHMSVLGFALGKTVYPICYSEKTKHMLEDIGFEDNYCAVEDIDKLSMKSVEENAGFLLDDSIVKRAEEHFIELDKLFKR